MIIPLLVLFVFGAIIGSFLNVVGIRYNSGLSLNGRSFCVVCRKKLAWWELIPVLSYICLRGRCSECKTKISSQYALIELWTGIVFVSIFYPLLQGTLYLELFVSKILLAVAFSIFTVILIYDARHKIIPDPLVYTAIGVSVLYRFVIGGTFLDWITGPILFTFFALIWLLSRGRAMGFGDAKLVLSIGFLLGFAEGISGIVLAFWIGTVVTLTYMLVLRIFSSLSRNKKGLTMKSEIPFAPFLIIGAWIAMAFELNLFHVVLY